MTLEDVGLQVQSLMQELQDEQRVSMLCVMNEGKESKFVTVGEPVNLLISCAIGVGQFLADHTGDMMIVKSFCNMVTEAAKIQLKDKGKAN